MLPAGGEDINTLHCEQGMSAFRATAVIILLVSRRCMLLCLENIAEAYYWYVLCLLFVSRIDRFGDTSTQCEMNHFATLYYCGQVLQRTIHLSDFLFVVTVET